MTKEEYEKICDILDEEIETVWVSMFYQRRSINLGGVARIKDKLKEMITEDKKDVKRSKTRR